MNNVEIPGIAVRALAMALCLSTAACEDHTAPAPEKAAKPRFTVNGVLENKELVEASGIQAGSGGRFYTHNDGGDGPSIFAIDRYGNDLGSFKLRDARNKDWEDLTWIPRDDGNLLVLGDIGDNDSGRKTVQLYFVGEPEPAQNGRFSGKEDVLHKVKLRYPDGPRDCEAMAYDASSDQLLFLTKRDKPPQLYALAVEDALGNDEVTLELLGAVPRLRPPSRKDLLKHPNRGMWIGQPTGMDISRDGRRAAVVGYRSVYLYHRNPDENWLQAFQRPPAEIIGPPGLHREAISFSDDGAHIIVTTEKRPAPVHQIETTAFDPGD
jgi:hypothetical protein